MLLTALEGWERTTLRETDFELEAKNMTEVRDLLDIPLCVCMYVYMCA